ncbi:NUDIX hydrolase [Candidatus Gracilibacteria bacterium]|nr:NUDIX hydrolase [Candidatus Gracilibacteria bacterium]
MKIPKNATKVFSGKTFDVYQWEQEMFDGSKKIFEKLKRNDSVDIIAINKNNEIYILEEEHPGREPFFGLVGGSCENGEKPIETAKRELFEETGLQSNSWEVFGIYSRSSRIEQNSNIFIARNCEKVGEQSLDSGEKIKFKIVNWDEFLKIVANPKFRVQEFALEVFREIFLGREKELKNRIFGKELTDKDSIR